MATHGRWKTYLLVAVGLLVVVAVLGGIKGAQIGKLIGMGKQFKVMGPPPEAVGSAEARADTWETTVSAVGSISSLRNVAVSNEVPGTVSKIRFESGQIAKEGQVLVELDAEVERAQLASVDARRDLAGRNAERSRKLAAGNVISKAQLDDVEAQLKTATTDTAALRAQVDRKVIRAPFRGRLGIRAVNVGQYLTPGTTVTTLDAMGGTFADFTLPQEELSRVAVGLPVRVTMEGKKEPLTGTISAIDPTVDLATRNVKIRAAIPDLPDAPRPGTFVTVDVIKPTKAEVVAVPATAIVHASYGDSVFVIEDKKPGSPGMDTTPDGKTVKIARQQFVRTGAARGDFVAITKGVTAGQQVVSAGAFKLRNNTPVIVDNTVQAKAELAPHPPNR
ncbi:MAG TPA: efflux RND transporter periplasmic adaptor subunit [Polyangia bacterium]|nr:efflux RND transporter periplasmic adaptor subunit [Polyangia bacterium]